MGHNVALIGAGDMGSAIGARGQRSHRCISGGRCRGSVGLCHHQPQFCPDRRICGVRQRRCQHRCQTRPADHQHVVDRSGNYPAACKDLNSAQDLARITNTSMPLTAICNEVRWMLTSAGLGGKDQAALIEYFRGPRTKDLNNS